MRNRTPPSFTVETKFGGRHQRTVIPHRATAPAAPRPVVSWPPPIEAQAPAAEPRRILPNLIVPEPTQVEPEPAQTRPKHMQNAEELSSKPRRGRPAKVKLVAAEVVEEPITRVAIEVPPAEPVRPSAPRTATVSLMRAKKPSAHLALGERWKRRLERWSR